MRLMPVAIFMLAPLLAAAGPLEEAENQYADENFEEALGQLEAMPSAARGERGERLLGLTLHRMQQYQRARAPLEAALARNGSDAEVLRALSDIYRAADDSGRSLDMARRLVGVRPSDRNELLLARALVADGRESDAQRVLRDLTGSTSIRVAQSAGVELAQLLLEQGDTAQARSVAEAAEALRPGSFVAYELRDFLSRLEQPAQATDSLRIALGFRVDYDDNVLLLPDDPGDFILATDQSDTRLNVLADVVYRRPLNRNLEFFAEAHFRHGELLDLSQFSSSSLRAVGGLGGSQERWGWRVPVELGKEWLDSDSFRDTVVISPGAYYRVSDVDLLYGYLRYQDDDFDGFDQSSSQDPSGDRTGIGLLYLRQFPAVEGNLRVIGEVAEVDADGRNVTRDEWRLYGYYNWMFAPDWEAGFGAQYLSADYDNVHDVFLTERDDDVFDVFAHLAYQFDEHWQIRGQLTTGDRDSAIDAFDYDRTVISIGINWNN